MYLGATRQSDLGRWIWTLEVPLSSSPWLHLATIDLWQDFPVVPNLMKSFMSLHGFGERSLKIRDVCMDFKPYFKVHNLVSVHPKSIILGQMTNLNMIFHVVVSVYRLVKIWNSPQSPAEFRNGLFYTARGKIHTYLHIQTGDDVIPHLQRILYKQFSLYNNNKKST